MLVVSGTYLALGQPWVELHLVDGRCYARRIDDGAQVGRLEVGNTGRECLALLLKFQNRFPGFDVEASVGRGPVNEIEVDVVKS